MPYDPRADVPEEQLAARARFKQKLSGMPVRFINGPFAMAIGQPESYWKGSTKGMMEAAYGAEELKNPGKIDLELLHLRAFQQACGNKQWREIKHVPDEGEAT